MKVLFHGVLCVLAVSACSSADAGPGADLGVPVEDAGGVPDGGDLGASDLSNADFGGCPAEMVRIAGFCVDRFEAYTVELDSQGAEIPHSPFQVINGATVRAKNAAGQYPQGYISQVEATMACTNAGKRLCSAGEFAQACRGASATNYYPYGGQTRIKGYCNEGKGSSMPLFFGTNPQNWTYADFNDPRLNQWDGGLAPSGSYPHCVSPYGVYDCVGNLHEWGSDAADANGHGRFRGGFYGDAEINGHGCLYVTSAHELTYHDYSTGFRCCKDPQ
jgi:formylglycine-generating enzyme required for sulfatase activity